MISVLGLGPMGQALTSALLDAGQQVTVWNRTPAKAASVRARGAQWADDPAAAVTASAVTLINVVDQSALDAVVSAAGDAVAGRVIVGLASDTPEAARATAALVEKLGGRYLDGAIMTPTDTVGSREARILFAGPRDLYDAHRAVFDTLATTTWLGEDPGRAAAYDMALLDLFWTSVSGVLHAVNVARANGISPDELLPHAQGIVGILPPIVDDLLGRLAADRHDESTASVSSVAASVRHLIAASRAAGVDAGALEALRGYVDAAVAAGYGADEISRIAHMMR
ncbi:NAD(P)-dependent oxidoreductase [Mycolicibacterium litorale]|uniref:6-phosphogluconate dehydrogenase n=1 Tax=Mycolicibacterium litorale TaxID=758802 RepID=A0AAD1IPT5_9MYCO|nr:NAD(P)-binding domain-containing protein [Mycolicibacterium litorale]MCV7417806.1 NAD(P)-dependent oxidoreductase [Mycolicibacterium litorale]TDY06805.1 3-hydroxyisobutyrate dehydrogenase-like beta-hydroxyacid dehydrogenase [Mycolicibacterium litorale]BBY19039.1 6-phosphogluconate dehydrogenase [Mycolicibacterium litorale]